jgi:DNA-binding MurR/RpiR family transcriptional regulator
MDQKSQYLENQNQQEMNTTARDLDQERQDFQRMAERQSEAARVYTMGKLRTA